MSSRRKRNSRHPRQQTHSEPGHSATDATSSEPRQAEGVTSPPVSVLDHILRVKNEQRPLWPTTIVAFLAVLALAAPIIIARFNPAFGEVLQHGGLNPLTSLFFLYPIPALFGLPVVVGILAWAYRHVQKFPHEVITEFGSSETMQGLKDLTPPLLLLAVTSLATNQIGTVLSSAIKDTLDDPTASLLSQFIPWISFLLPILAVMLVGYIIAKRRNRRNLIDSDIINLTFLFVFAQPIRLLTEDVDRGLMMVFQSSSPILILCIVPALVGWVSLYFRDIAAIYTEDIEPPEFSMSFVRGGAPLAGLLFGIIIGMGDQLGWSPVMLIVLLTYLPLFLYYRKKFVAIRERNRARNLLSTRREEDKSNDAIITKLRLGDGYAEIPAISLSAMIDPLLYTAAALLVVSISTLQVHRIKVDAFPLEVIAVGVTITLYTLRFLYERGKYGNILSRNTAISVRWQVFLHEVYLVGRVAGLVAISIYAIVGVYGLFYW